MKKRIHFLILPMILSMIFCVAACRSMGYRSMFFDDYIKPKFPKRYTIRLNEFTDEEIASIKQGFKNWEPTIQKISGTVFQFEFMGYTMADFDSSDDIHVVLKQTLDSSTLGRAHLLISRWPPPPGGDIVINDAHDTHTTDQWHLGGWRELVSYCLEALVTHEVGHLMGLGHSLYSGDVMYERNEQRCQRRPTQNDEAALESHYRLILRDYFDMTWLPKEAETAL